jgi:hypothetical protein
MYFNARAELIYVSLITRNMATNELRMHRLMQGVVRQRMKENELRTVYAAVTVLLSAVCHMSAGQILPENNCGESPFLPPVLSSVLYPLPIFPLIFEQLLLTATTIPTMATDQIEVIGGKKNFWLRSKEGFDLTHPSTPTSPLIYPRIPLKTTVGRVTIDPMKTALVVVDLQNYFLSPSLGRPSDSVGMKVVDQLLKYVIPACRKANMPVVWLNWGLTEEDIEEMPPTIVRGFAADGNFEGGR